MAADLNLVDDQITRIPFDDKVEDWTLTMCDGRGLNLGDQPWQDFRRLRAFRNYEMIHVKSTAYAVSLELARETLNFFRQCAAKLLVLTHRAIDQKMPFLLIRCSVRPAVYITEASEWQAPGMKLSFQFTSFRSFHNTDRLGQVKVG